MVALPIDGSEVDILAALLRLPELDGVTEGDVAAGLAIWKSDKPYNWAFFTESGKNQTTNEYSRGLAESSALCDASELTALWATTPRRRFFMRSPPL